MPKQAETVSAWCKCLQALKCEKRNVWNLYKYNMKMCCCFCCYVWITWAEYHADIFCRSSMFLSPSRTCFPSHVPNTLDHRFYRTCECVYVCACACVHACSPMWLCVLYIFVISFEFWVVVSAFIQLSSSLTQHCHHFAVHMNSKWPKKVYVYVYMWGMVLVGLNFY